MKKNDFEIWLNADLNEVENDAIEQKMMRDLGEYRLKEQLKTRLQKQRSRRRLWRFGLFSILVLSIIGGILFKINSTTPPPSVPAPQQQLITPQSDTISTQKPPLIADIQAKKPVDNSKNIENEQLSTSEFYDEIADNRTSSNTASDFSTTTESYSGASVSNNVRTESPRIAESSTKYNSATDTLYTLRKSRNEGIRYRIEENDYQEKSTLTDLNLSKKKLDNVPPSVFEHTNLQFLVLNNNNIQNVSPHINTLNQLVYLDLSVNKIGDLPLEIAQLENLIELNIRKNKLKYIPVGIYTLPNLRKLEASDNKIKSLSENINLLRNLEILNLKNNDLQTLPDNIAQLGQLKRLDISLNLFTKFPTVVLGLTQLEYLDLSSNRLTSLPQNIDSLQQIKHLDLHSNTLSRLPDNFENLQSLEWLDIHNNIFMGLPPQLENLKNLKYLNVRSNSLNIDEVHRLERIMPNCYIEY